MLYRKNVDFLKTNDCQLISALNLAFAYTNKPFFLSVDASSSVLGFILGQYNNSNREVVISYGCWAFRGILS